MKLYSRLSDIGFLKQKYSVKFLFISFLGIHIPLIGLIFYISFSRFSQFSPGQVLISTLVLTLASTIVTLWVQHSLIIPVISANKALREYLSQNKLPHLPVHYEDEVGILMRDLNGALYTLDAHINEKKELINMLSHDLRTPMGNILMLTQFIRTGQSKDEIENYLSMIDVSVETQLNIMGTILQLMRTEMNENEFVAGVNLKMLIDKVIAQYQTSLSLKEIKLVIDVPDDLEVTFNPHSFELLIYNLLSNSVKFSRAGGEVIISARVEDDQLKITVKDRGRGFRPEDAETIFDPFTKKSRKGTAGESSTGVGLYFSRKIVQSHLGTITACSDGHNTGATFLIQIPATLKVEEPEAV